MTVAVWRGADGELLGRLSDQSVTALAFSDDGRALAVGDERGRVRVFRAPALTLQREYQCSQAPIRAVAIGRPLEFGADESKDDVRRQLLATGDDNGVIIVWRMEDNIPANVVRRTVHQLNALRFSPDGMTLAEASHRTIRFYDVATGRPMLDLPRTGYLTSVAFSPDGKRVATAGHADDPKSTTRVWRLEDGKGVYLLRGLSSPGVKAVLSSDNQFVAGLSNDWRIGVWRFDTRRLVQLFDAPAGITRENSGLAFDEQNGSLYFSAGEVMTRWSLNTGEILQRWRLASGLQDNIAFHENRVLLFRYETASRKAGPFSSNPSEQDPRVCRVYEALADGGLRELSVVNELSQRIYGIAATRDGRYVAIDGRDAAGLRKMVVLNGQTGEREHVFEVGPSVKSTVPIMLARDARRLIMRTDSVASSSPVAAVIDLETGNRLRDLKIFASATDPDAARFVINNGSASIFDLERQAELFRFTGRLASYYASDISADGNFAVWANLDGTIALCRIPQVLQRLKEVGYETN